MIIQCGRIQRWGLGAVLAATMLAGAAWAGPGKGPQGDRTPGDGFEMRAKRIHRQLGLSEEQEKKLTENREAHRASMKKLRDEMKEKREAIGAELEKPKLDMGRVRALHAELKALDAKRADQRLDGILEVRKILTPEQFKKFGEMMRGAGKDGSDRPGWKAGRCPNPNCEKGNCKKCAARRSGRGERRGPGMTSDDDGRRTPPSEDTDGPEGEDQ